MRGREDRTPKRMGEVRRRGEVLTQSWGASHRRGQPAGAGSQHLPCFRPGGAATRPGGERGRPSASLRFLPLLPCPLPRPPSWKAAGAFKRELGYPGGGSPSAESEAAALSAMLLTFCSCSRRDCRHPRRLLLRLQASFSAAGERSAMSGKFREGLAGAMLPGLSCRRPRAALCTRWGVGSPAARGQVAVRGERFDSPRWEGLWRWAECEAGDAAGETEVVLEKLGFSGRFLQLDSRDFGSRRHTVGPGPDSVAPGPASRPLPTPPAPAPARPSREAFEESAQLQVATQRRVCLCRLSPRDAAKCWEWEEGDGILLNFYTAGSSLLRDAVSWFAQVGGLFPAPAIRRGCLLQVGELSALWFLSALIGLQHCIDFSPHSSAPLGIFFLKKKKIS